MRMMKHMQFTEAATDLLEGLENNDPSTMKEVEEYMVMLDEAGRDEVDWKELDEIIDMAKHGMTAKDIDEWIREELEGGC